MSDWRLAVQQIEKDDESRRHAGDIAIHPFALACLIVLVTNDHLLKGRATGTLTGKLSDIAGLPLLLIVAVAVLEIARVLAHREPRVPDATILWLTGAAALGFTLVKTTAVGASLAASTLGVAKAPVRLLSSQSSRGLFEPVEVLVDTSDLLALAMLAPTWLLLRRRWPATSQRSTTAVPEENRSPAKLSRKSRAPWGTS